MVDPSRVLRKPIESVRFAAAPKEEYVPGSGCGKCFLFRPRADSIGN